MKKAVKGMSSGISTSTTKFSTPKASISTKTSTPMFSKKFKQGGVAPKGVRVGAMSWKNKNYKPSSGVGVGY